jgi:hypothetical protein
MIQAGYTFQNPLNQSHWLVIESDTETGGMGWMLEVRCAPNARPDIIEHLHLTWTETFEIISGKAHYKLNGVQKTAETGETIVMSPRQPQIHPWNAGETEMVFRQVTRFEKPDPQAVQDVLGVFVTLFGLAREGKIAKNGLPKNPLQFVATAKTLAIYDSYDGKIPIPLQKLTIAAFGWLAEALGYRGVYPRYVQRVNN